VWVVNNGSPAQVITGLGPGPDLKVKIPYILVRRHAASAKFIALLEPGPAEAKITSITNDNGTIHIRSAKWEDTIELGGKIAYRRVAAQ
jgi:hypothetical protein